MQDGEPGVIVWDDRSSYMATPPKQTDLVFNCTIFEGGFQHVHSTVRCALTLGTAAMYCILALVTMWVFARYRNTQLTKFSSESLFFLSLLVVSTARAASFVLLPMIHIQWRQFWPMLASMFLGFVFTKSLLVFIWAQTAIMLRTGDRWQLCTLKIAFVAVHLTLLAALALVREFHSDA